jgi:hypothetical protein
MAEPDKAMHDGLEKHCIPPIFGNAALLRRRWTCAVLLE